MLGVAGVCKSRIDKGFLFLHCSPLQGGRVAGFLVEDVESARGVLEAEGIEFIAPVHEWEPTGEAWSHFRAPDGNVYEITYVPKHR